MKSERSELFSKPLVRKSKLEVERRSKCLFDSRSDAKIQQGNEQKNKGTTVEEAKEGRKEGREQVKEKCIIIVRNSWGENENDRIKRMRQVTRERKRQV